MPEHTERYRKSTPAMYSGRLPALFQKVTRNIEMHGNLATQPKRPELTNREETG